MAETMGVIISFLSFNMKSVACDKVALVRTNIHSSYLTF